MKLSEQAMGAVMLALQNSILEQTDIVPVLTEFDFQLNEREELVVLNPPLARVLKEVEDNFFDEEEISKSKNKSIVLIRPRKSIVSYLLYYKTGFESGEVFMVVK